MENKTIILIMALLALPATAQLETADRICTPLNSTHQICTQTQYTYPQRNQYNQTLQDLATITENNDVITIITPEANITFAPIVTQDNTLVSLDMARNTTPSLRSQSFIDAHASYVKFGYELSSLPSPGAEEITQVGYTITVESQQRFPIRRDKNTLSTNTITIDFNDVIDDIAVLNTTRVLTNRTSFDPVITLNYTQSVTDHYFTDRVRGGNPITLMRWDIRDIPYNISIVNATLELRETCTFICPPSPGSDLNLSRINNQTWTFGTPETGANGLNKQLTNTSYDDWWGPLTNGTWWYANVTQQLAEDYYQGNNYTSFWLEDESTNYLDGFGARVDATTVKYGSLFNQLNFYSMQGTLQYRPRIVIVYTAETNPPNITNIHPINDTWIPPTLGDHQNFSCNVTDENMIDYTWVFTDVRNGSWERIFWDYADYWQNHSYTFYWNYSDWFLESIWWTDPPVDLPSSNGRSISGNNTHFLIAEYQNDELVWFDHQGNRIYNYSTVDEWIIDIDWNGTNITQVDIISEKLYFTDWEGNQTKVCNLASDGYVTGVCYDMDNATVWTVWDNGTVTYLRHVDQDCNLISQYSNLPGGNPETCTVSHGVVYYNEPGLDKILGYNVSANQNIENVTNFDVIMGSTYDPKGIWMNKSNTYPEWIYTTPVSPNSLGSARRILQEENFTWACYACDDYGNCNYGENWTWSVGTTTSTTTSTTSTTSISTTTSVETTTTTIPTTTTTIPGETSYAFTAKNHTFTIQACTKDSTCTPYPPDATITTANDDPVIFKITPHQHTPQNITQTQTIATAGVAYALTALLLGGTTLIMATGATALLLK